MPWNNMQIAKHSNYCYYYFHQQRHENVFRLETKKLILTRENEQSVDRIAMSIGVVWFATQNPQLFGRYSLLWMVTTADNDRQIMRNDILNAKSFKYRRVSFTGISPTSANVAIIHNT